MFSRLAQTNVWAQTSYFQLIVVLPSLGTVTLSALSRITMSPCLLYLTQIVLAVAKDLGLHNRDQTGRLAD